MALTSCGNLPSTTLISFFVPALRWYAAEHRADRNVPTAFLLGEEACQAAELPRHVTEYWLKQTVANVRSRKDFVDGQPENQAVLDAIDFVWDSGEKRGR
jgi:hypothetical protein